MNLKRLFGAIVVVLMTMTVPDRVKADTPTADSLSVSLLTCSPHEHEVYALYGHTAIRCHDWRKDFDWVFNYGVFNFRQPFFVMRFVLGMTDYELGVVPFDVFIGEYRRQHRGVVEQQLNLTRDEKLCLVAALLDNCTPDNRVYRYNFFSENCTSKARDIIERCINGRIVYCPDGDDSLSYRNLIHGYTLPEHRWAAFGNDLCLGVKADFATSQTQRQFLPERLMADFAQADILTPDGERRRLTEQTTTLLEPSPGAVAEEDCLVPMTVMIVLVLLCVIVAAVEYIYNKVYKWWDILLFTLTSVPGLIVVLLFLSEHPTTSTNLQALLLNPLPLLFVPWLVKGRSRMFWRMELALSLAYIAGAFWQDYAEGMELLALCLLTRCWTHRQQIVPMSKKKQ